MAWRLNPFTGEFDYYESSQGNGQNQQWQKTPVEVDNIFLVNKTVNLQGSPIMNTDFVFVNGLLIKDDCYTINGAQLIFEPTTPLKVGYKIDIRYAI